MHSNYFSTALLLVGSLSVLATACDWDSVDPRLSAGGGNVGGDSGVGGAGVGGEPEGGGGSTGGGGNATLDCGAVDVATDDFDDDMRDPSKWSAYADYGGSTEETGSQLVMSVGVSQYADNYYETWGYVNLEGRSISVEVVQPLSVVSSGHINFEAAKPGGNVIRMRASVGGQLIGYKVVDGGAAEVFNIAFNPTDHRFWRFRTNENVTIWEASADGMNFTKLAEEPMSALFDMEYVRVRLTVDNNDDLMGDAVIWDNLSADGPGTGAWCGVETFIEDFSEPLPSQQWLNSFHDDTATAKVVDGQLYLTPNDGEDSDYFYRSSRLFDLTGQGLSVELVQALEAPSTTFLRAASASEWLGIEVTGDPDPEGDPTVPVLAVKFHTGGDTTTLGTTPYAPAQHRWLRLREDDGTLVWESSPDGQDWTVEGQQTPSPVTTLENMRVELGADATETTPTPGQAIFDNLNNLP